MSTPSPAPRPSPTYKQGQSEVLRPFLSLPLVTVNKRSWSSTPSHVSVMPSHVLICPLLVLLHQGSLVHSQSCLLSITVRVTPLFIPCPPASRLTPTQTRCWSGVLGPLLPASSQSQTQSRFIRVTPLSTFVLLPLGQHQPRQDVD